MERNYAIDYFKFFAILCVVCIHTAPFSETMFWGIDGNDINFVINTFARFGVPFFFIVSGFLFGQKLMNSNTNTVYFGKYIMKIIKLFSYWSLFYIAYGLVLTILQAFEKGINIKIEIYNYLSNLVGLKSIITLVLYGIGGPASFHLWYLAALIWCILTIFIFIKLNKLKTLLYLSLCLNIIGLCGQTYSGLFNLEFLDFIIPTTDALFFGLFYTTFGTYFALNYERLRHKIIKVKTTLLVVLFFIFSLTQICERLIAEIFWEEKIRATDYYLSTIFITICLFLFVLKNGHIGKTSKISKVGKNAVGIYVSHTLFINLTYLVFSKWDIQIREYFIFHLLFTPIIFVIAYLFYNLLQIIKSTIVMKFYKNRAPLSETGRV